MLLNSAGLPRIRSHAEAVARLENTMPYRSGEQKGKKPLGNNRRYKTCRIERIEGTEAIALQLHDSDVVVWYPDDTVQISLCGFDTVSTRQFIWGTTIYDIKHDRGTTYIGVPDPQRGTAWYAFHDLEAPLILKGNVVLNPKAESIYKVNIKALKDKRKEFSAFREYIANMGSVLTGIKDEEVNALMQKGPDFVSGWGINKMKSLNRLVIPTVASQYFHRDFKPMERLVAFTTRLKRAQDENDLEFFYNAFILLGASTLHFNSYLRAFIANHYSSEDVYIKDTLVKFFDEVIKYVYRDEVFVAEEVPLGKKVSNVNRKYFI